MTYGLKMLAIWKMEVYFFFKKKQVSYAGKFRLYLCLSLSNADVIFLKKVSIYIAVHFLPEKRRFFLSRLGKI